MKWDHRRKFEKCLNQAFETYTDLLEASDFSLDEIDELEALFRHKIQTEDYESLWVSAQEIESYDRLHNETQDNSDFYGAVISIFDNGKYLIIDGNHRINSALKLVPNLKIFMIIIECKNPRGF